MFQGVMVLGFKSRRKQLGEVMDLLRMAFCSFKNIICRYRVVEQMDTIISPSPKYKLQSSLGVDWTVNFSISLSRPTHYNKYHL